MTLAEFINKRLAELGMKRSDLVNKFDLEWATLGKITHGHSIKSVTQQKLALALQCTQGDIQECMAEQNPLKNVIVNKKSLAKLKKPEADTVQMVMEEKPYVTPAPDPEDEEPAQVFQPEPEEDEEDEEQAEYTYSETKKFEQMALDDYRQKLRDMCLRIFASGVPGMHTIEKIYADIGYAIVKELVQEGEEDEAL